MLDVNQGWPNEIAIKNLEKYMMKEIYLFQEVMIVERIKKN